MAGSSRRPLVGPSRFLVDRIHRHKLRRHRGQLGLFVSEARLSSQPVDGLVPRGSVKPGARISRDVAGPLGHGDGEGFLQCLLGDIEVAEEVNECRKKAAPFGAEDLLDRGQDHDMIVTRTS